MKEGLEETNSSKEGFLWRRLGVSLGTWWFPSCLRNVPLEEASCPLGQSSSPHGAGLAKALPWSPGGFRPRADPHPTLPHYDVVPSAQDALKSVMNIFGL